MIRIIIEISNNHHTSRVNILADLTIFITWLYNNTRGSLVIAILAHLAFNLVGGVVTGTLGLMTMNTLLMFGVPGLTILLAWVLIYFGPRYLSRKPVTELPFHPKA
jgi:hypothetical protein